ncbi:hypothetical protein ACGFR8_31455 [Streptomyces brevispora]|uniref:hypothetical protein n=1 Tax=Streptomyces brevispora TaxID=887462 RepID=UPI00371334E8
MNEIEHPQGRGDLGWGAAPADADPGWGAAPSPPRYGRPVMPHPVQNPLATHGAWLAVNFVPAEQHAELERWLGAVQEQAVHIAARDLRAAGHTAAADLIDPLPAHREANA